MDTEKDQRSDLLKLAHKDKIFRFETYISENNKKIWPSMRELKKYEKRVDELLQEIFEIEELLVKRCGVV